MVPGRMASSVIWSAQPKPFAYSRESWRIMQSSIPLICQRRMKFHTSFSILPSFSESDISLVSTALMPRMERVLLLPDLPEGMARISTTSRTRTARAA